MPGRTWGSRFSFSLVNLMDPNAPVQIPLLGQMFGLLGTLVVLGAGLHRTMLEALFRTFATAPVGTVTLDPRAGGALVMMAGGIFAAALQLSAPVITATVLAEMAIVAAGRKAGAAAAGDGHRRAGEDAPGVRSPDRIAGSVAALDRNAFCCAAG